LQEEACCEPRTVNIEDKSLEVNSNAVAAQCTYPRCTEQTLGDFIILNAATRDRATGCTARSIKVRPLFSLKLKYIFITNINTGSKWDLLDGIAIISVFQYLPSDQLRDKVRRKPN